jgi:hypothetical protein
MPLTGFFGNEEVFAPPDSPVDNGRLGSDCAESALFNRVCSFPNCPREKRILALRVRATSGRSPFGVVECEADEWSVLHPTFFASSYKYLLFGGVGPRCAADANLLCVQQ